MNSETANEVWSAQLDAELNSRYWRLMALRYARRELHAKMFLAVTASATVASWALWEHVKAMWQMLSGLSAVISVALPTIDVPGKVERMNDAQAAWTSLMHEYDDLWRQRVTLSATDFSDKLKVLRSQEVAASSKTKGLPSDDTALSKRCYEEILQSRGLQS